MGIYHLSTTRIPRIYVPRQGQGGRAVLEVFARPVGIRRFCFLYLHGIAGMGLGAAGRRFWDLVSVVRKIGYHITGSAAEEDIISLKLLINGEHGTLTSRI
jgi:hypothetical protein